MKVIKSERTMEEEYTNVMDEDCHWYYIPKHMKDDFYKEEEDGEADEWSAFNEKWSQYRTGGGPK